MEKIRKLTQIRKMGVSHELAYTYHYLKNKLHLYEVDYEMSLGKKKQIVIRTEWYNEIVRNKQRIHKITIKEYQDKDKVMELVTYEEKYEEEMC